MPACWLRRLSLRPEDRLFYPSPNDDYEDFLQESPIKDSAEMNKQFYEDFKTELTKEYDPTVTRNELVKALRKSLAKSKELKHVLNYKKISEPEVKLTSSARCMVNHVSKIMFPMKNEIVGKMVRPLLKEIVMSDIQFAIKNNDDYVGPVSDACLLSKPLLAAKAQAPRLRATRQGNRSSHRNGQSTASNKNNALLAAAVATMLRGGKM